VAFVPGLISVEQLPAGSADGCVGEGDGVSSPDGILLGRGEAFPFAEYAVEEAHAFTPPQLKQIPEPSNQPPVVQMQGLPCEGWGGVPISSSVMILNSTVMSRGSGLMRSLPPVIRACSISASSARVILTASIAVAASMAAWLMIPCWPMFDMLTLTVLYPVVSIM